MLNSNLPGVFSDIKDGGLSSDLKSLSSTTESLLIIGTAIDGPNNTVFRANSIQEAIDLYGHFRDSQGNINGASLIRGAIEAYNAGCRDIRLFRLGGTKATASKKLTGKPYSLYIESKYAGSMYNKVEFLVDIANERIIVTKPNRKVMDGEKIVDVLDGAKKIEYRLNSIISYNDKNDIQLTRFINAFNNYVYNNVLTLKIYDEEGNDVTTVLNQNILDLKLTDLNMAQALALKGGDDGINDTLIKKYMMLGGFVKEHILFDKKITSSDYIATTQVYGFENSIYDVLSNYKVDNVVVLDLYPEVRLDFEAITADKFTDVYAYVDASEQGLYVKDLTGQANKQIKIVYDTTNSVEVNTNQITVKVKEGSTYSEVADLINSNVNTKSILFAKGGCKKATKMTDFVNISGKLYTTKDNFARQLAQACAVISSKTNECVGVIGCAPVLGSDLITVKKHVDRILGITNNNIIPIHASTMYDLTLKTETGEYLVGEDGKPIDIGGYVNIVFGPDIAYVDNVIGVYAVNGAAAYAGLITTLKPEYSTTNKKLEGTMGLRYELSGKQLSDLTSAGYVTFRNSYSSGIVVTDGVTAAGTNSDFTRLTTKRITSAVVNVVRKAAEPFIGLPNNTAERNALSTAIQAALDAMKNGQAIQDFKFEVYSSKIDQRLGNAVIDLVIVPSFEFRKIRLLVNLKNSI